MAEPFAERDRGRGVVLSQLVVTQLAKTFEAPFGEVRVLDEISFQLGAGENLAITGPSGSGKSTLLHILGTLERPTAGSVSIEGVNPFELPEIQMARFRNREIGFVFQDHHLLPQYSVLENVLIPTAAYGTAREHEEEARKILGRVGLEHRLDFLPGEISGGERQRAAVARALINHPKLLLCDEPTGNLDQHTADSVAELLLEIGNDEQTILIVVTHSLDLAKRFKRRFELREGRCSEA